MRDPWQTHIGGHSREGAEKIRLKRGRFAAELFSNINCILLSRAAALRRRDQT
jgi:hypothetical protein